jgi:adenylate cyclase
MNNKAFLLGVLALIALTTYLFVEAPAPLPDGLPGGKTVPVAVALAITQAENALVRALYTQEIVGAGKQVGLAFREDWRERDVDAGPLPALFLRETARSLEKHPVRLSLFLGSEFPINAANRFTGGQLERFQTIKERREPQVFYAADTQLHTAMFPDIGGVQPCITCHNQHPQSPKTDWQLHDVMGATTWMYPEAEVTLEALMAMIAALRQGFREAYSAYLAKAATFTRLPELGDKWPRDGYYLPTAEVFMAACRQRVSAGTLDAMVRALEGEK